MECEIKTVTGKGSYDSLAAERIVFTRNEAVSFLETEHFPYMKKALVTAVKMSGILVKENDVQRLYILM